VQNRQVADSSLESGQSQSIREFEHIKAADRMHPSPFLFFTNEFLERSIHFNLKVRTVALFRWMMPLFAIIHWLGKRHVAFTVAPILLYSFPDYYSLGVAFAFYPQITTMFTSLLKDVLQVPRLKWLVSLPPHVQKATSWAQEKSFATPSAHSSVFATTALLGALNSEGYVAITLFSVLGVFVLVCTMISRMFLMVHYLHDVLIGAALGLCLTSVLFYSGLMPWVLKHTYEEWTLALTFGVIWGVLVLMLNILHAFQLQLPHRDYLQFYRHNGNLSEHCRFWSFKVKSWYHGTYVVIGALSIDCLLHMPKWSLDNEPNISPRMRGYLSYDNARVDLSLISPFAAVMIFFFLKVSKSLEATLRKKIEDEEVFSICKDTLRITCYAFVSWFTFFFVPFYFAQVVRCIA